MSFPFLFYGAAPAEWYGGGGRLDYEVRFRTAPADGARTAIAHAVRAAGAGFAEIRLDVHDRWHWAEAWARLVVRTRTSETDWAVFFDEVAALFRAVDAACPVELVVCRSVDAVRADDDPWTAWSLAARPDIGPRPLLGRQLRRRRSLRRRALAPGRRRRYDAAFEAARRSA
ncbi:MAG: hypothetical protein HS111_27825 [Kofleriaceae bacterium]|nr:hypothetical protein [Kofleriaceae bacterium]